MKVLWCLAGLSLGVAAPGWATTWTIPGAGTNIADVLFNHAGPRDIIEITRDAEVGPFDVIEEYDLQIIVDPGVTATSTGVGGPAAVIHAAGVSIRGLSFQVSGSSVDAVVLVAGGGSCTFSECGFVGGAGPSGATGVYVMGNVVLNHCVVNSLDGLRIENAAHADLNNCTINASAVPLVSVAGSSSLTGCDLNSVAGTAMDIRSGCAVSATECSMQGMIGLVDAQAEFLDCALTGPPQPPESGGGVLCSFSQGGGGSLRLEDCTWSGRGGIGLKIADVSHAAATPVSATRCTFSGWNKAVKASGGDLTFADCSFLEGDGGIDAENTAGLSVTNCQVKNQGEFGISSSMTESILKEYLRIDNCVIVSNTSKSYSQGIYLYDLVERNPKINHNTISGWGRGLQFAGNTVAIGGGTEVKWNIVAKALDKGVDLNQANLPFWFLNNVLWGAGGCLGEGIYEPCSPTSCICSNVVNAQFVDPSNKILNPRFCGDHPNIDDLDVSLRVDSPCSAVNGVYNERVGAEDVACAWGPLARSSTAAGDATIMVPEDVIVPAGLNLTLLPGATLKFDEEDGYPGGGSDVLESELVVDGSLVVGQNNEPAVVLTTTNAEASPGDWGGVTVHGGAATVTNTIIKGAEDACVIEGPEGAVSASSVTVLSGINGFRVLNGGELTATSCDITVVGNGVKCKDGNLSITASTVHGGPRGLYLGGGIANVSSSSLLASSAVGSVAVEVIDDETVPGVPTLSMHNWCVIGEAEVGLEASGGSATFQTGTIRDCAIGVWADGNASVSIGGSGSYPPLVTVQDCALEGVTVLSSEACTLENVKVLPVAGIDDWVGIHLMPGSNATLTRVEVPGAGIATGSGVTGIFVESDALIRGPKVSSLSRQTLGCGISIDADSLDSITLDEAPAYSGLWQTPQVTGCYSGVAVNGFARPVIRNSLITDHYMYCVQIGPAAVPNLGHDWNQNYYGNNSIYATLPQHVRGKLAGGPARLGGIPVVPAEMNWWGDRHGPAAKKVSSWVDYYPYLIDAPTYELSVDVEMTAATWHQSVLGPCHPVPSSGRVIVPFRVAPSEAVVDVAIFDIMGRRVRSLLKEMLPAGEKQVEWDGTLASGERAPRGVYFVRVMVGQEEASQRLVLSW